LLRASIPPLEAPMTTMSGRTDNSCAIVLPAVDERKIDAERVNFSRKQLIRIPQLNLQSETKPGDDSVVSKRFRQTIWG
jgi:hypothetical protein